MGQKTLIGHNAITEYWRQRFIEKPAGDLEDLQVNGDTIVELYAVPDGIVQAIVRFNPAGKIVQSQCGPLATVSLLKKGASVDRS
ncbi:hypothetical protein J6524_19625 [Bradyrhizobium sp. WSM 1738]|uniref:hypothetical protein n=1 Tax=Bradyrhizobium hereditatis TaxID=2821405 RepID=UPI001CE2DDC0|nr:hypothetical protein [Bradyrhizobium hereditatis]MCA6117066.1 hypothetical protein [Bradyrhizobium hereditatis]